MTPLIDCPGCKAKLPRVTSGELLDMLGPSALRETVHGVRVCLRVASMWHVPEALSRPRSSAARTPPPLGRPKARKPGEPLEEDVYRGICEVLTLEGWDVMHFEQGYRPDKCRSCGAPLERGKGSSMIEAGTPDLYVVGHGRSFWIEVKRPGGAITERQWKWHKRARAGSVHVYIVRSAQAAAVLSYEILNNKRPRWPIAGEFPPIGKE